MTHSIFGMMLNEAFNMNEASKNKSKAASVDKRRTLSIYSVRGLEEETNKIKEERGFFRYNGISWPSEVEFQDGTIFYQTGRESVNSYKRK